MIKKKEKRLVSGEKAAKNSGKQLNKLIYIHNIYMKLDLKRTEWDIKSEIILTYLHN